MIRFTLKCTHGHSFESWLKDGATFDRLAKDGHLACAVCGSNEVQKAVMAPNVAHAEQEPARRPSLGEPAHPAEEALRALRARIEREAENVGRDFANEARRIHEGEADARPIYGEARADEARRLIEDDIPVAPLPFRSGKTN